MDERQTRRARNESLFREVNERIDQVEKDFSLGSEAEFVCECDELGCTQRFEMSLSEYEHLRADPTTLGFYPDTSLLTSKPRSSAAVLTSFASTPASRLG